MLVRLVLVYALECLSLRDAAAWAARVLGIELTGDALGYRFAHAVPLLQVLVMRLLNVRVPSARGPTLRLLDATVLNEPGSVGTSWRLHLTYDPIEGEITGIDLTGSKGAERLSRAGAVAGDLIVADAVYGRASQLRIARKRKLQCLLRAYLSHLVIADPKGKRLVPLALVEEADRGPVDRDVVLHERAHESAPARLVVVPLPQEQAARARQRLRDRARRRGRKPSRLALRLAGYFCCITTLSREAAPVQTLLNCYRIRWQVELLIKRCKSLLHLDKLTRASAPLARIQVWARLLGALLTEQMAHRTRATARDKPGAPPPSPWRLTRIHHIDLLLVVYGGASLDNRLASGMTTAERLRERPRRRQPWPAQLSHELAAISGPAPP
jgi:hypothetical protein